MRRIVVHGHFYQPPREEPWLELVPREPTATPDHDWNERITRECYAPLSRARVLDGGGRMHRVLNAWGGCSFDVGPTLFRWFDRHAPAVADAIVDADRASQIRLGAGNAIAMPYHHIILPLASYRDKVTEVRWGIRDFRRRFGREPEGMWLPETAMDEETLAVLASEGIRFTILAPHQVTNPPAFGRPGLWRDGHGRELALFCYDGVLSHDIAFGPLLKNADDWLRLMLERPMAKDGGLTIDSIATDGETFGHHHRFGDLSLAALIHRLEHHPDAMLTNFAALLKEAPPTEEVTVVAPTSWSCAHGVERWRSDCGCRFDANISQAWRAPLRNGLNQLAEELHAVAEQNWPGEAGDIWTTREIAGPDLMGAGDLPLAARHILEAERQALGMFTSCGWFFDDIGRLEPQLILRHAARALDFIAPEARAGMEERLLATLATAESFDYLKGSGADIWRRDVLSESHGPARLAAGIAALRAVAPDAVEELVIPTHRWHFNGDVIVTHHLRTGVEFRWLTTPRVSGVVAEQVQVREEGDPNALDVTLAHYPGPVRGLLREIAAPLVLHATFTEADREELADGLLSPVAVRERAMSGACALVERDGLDVAGILIHAVLDLYDLEETNLPDHLRIDLFERLSSAAPSDARDRLADRLWFSLPDTP